MVNVIDYALRGNAYGIQNNAYQDALYLIVDSAEDGDLDEYANNSGDFETVRDSAFAFNGEWYIRYDPSVAGNSAIQHDPDDTSFDSLPNLPSQGDTFSVRTYVTHSDNNVGIYFAVQENRNTYPRGYHFDVSGRSNEARLLENDPANGIHNEFASTAYTPSSGTTDQWNEPEVVWETDGSGNNVITGRYKDPDGNTLVEVGPASPQKLSFTSGGIGMTGDTETASDWCAFDFYINEQ